MPETFFHLVIEHGGGWTGRDDVSAPVLAGVRKGVVVPSMRVQRKYL